VAFGDTITLRNGQVVTGTYLGGTARQVRIDLGDQVQTFDVSDIVRIEFSTPAPQPPPPAHETAAPQPPPAAEVSLPAGTNFRNPHDRCGGFPDRP
jgi:hypothetical protein